jgi:hypothetical protein
LSRGGTGSSAREDEAIAEIIEAFEQKIGQKVERAFLRSFRTRSRRISPMTPEEEGQARQAKARVNRELARLAAALDAGDHATVEAFTRAWGPLDLPTEPEADPPPRTSSSRRARPSRRSLAAWPSG